MSATPKPKPARTPELALTIQYGARSAQLPSRAKLRQWARAALRRNARVTLRVVGAREARLLNLNYRGRDYATNVLTFIYSSQSPLEGDIAICAPVVAREAFARGISREQHYAHLTVHGLLHLQGHDHERGADAKAMEKLETRILAKLGFADPYRDATHDGKRTTATDHKHGR
ncbi:MAG: rRNA maturation RNase YbeY [Burkholderiales bacterium]